MTTTDARVGPAAMVAERPTRLAVAWQHPQTRLMEAVGLLTCETEGFTYDYLARAEHVPGFRPFLGFPDMGRVYRSSTLFPLFAQRVMRRSRPDYGRHLALLSLDGGANDWDVLARSQGQRQGDGIRLFAEPTVGTDGSARSTFFVSGLRHRSASDPGVATAVDALAEGEALTLVPEPGNPSDPRALLVSTTGGVEVGWVPHVLLDHAYQLQRGTASPEIRVVTVQPRDVVPSYRLLISLRGWPPAGPPPFSAPGWELAAATNDASTPSA